MIKKADGVRGWWNVAYVIKRKRNLSPESGWFCVVETIAGKETNTMDKIIARKTKEEFCFRSRREKKRGALFISCVRKNETAVDVCFDLDFFETRKEPALT